MYSDNRRRIVVPAGARGASLEVFGIGRRAGLYAALTSRLSRLVLSQCQGNPKNEMKRKVVDDLGLSSWTFTATVQVYEHAERCFQLDLSMDDLNTVKEIYRMAKD